MAIWGKCRKVDLLNLAAEMSIEMDATATVVALKEAIKTSRHYEEEFVETFLQTIVEDRLAKEEEERARKEEEERARKEEEKARKEEEKARKEEEKARKEEERARKEEERTRAKQLEDHRLFMEKQESENKFLLEKLKLEKSGSTNEAARSRPREEIHHLMQKYDPKSSDISLYLVLFERQAKRIALPEEQWVSHLTGLLPIEMAQLIARESEETYGDYEAIKMVLLNRYKLSPEKFRQLFFSHNKSQEETWKDFLFELKNYFFEWIKGLKVNTFEDLCNLILAEQVKRKTSFEMKTHFIDEWTQMKNPEKVAEKLDEYENVRMLLKKKTFSPKEKSFKPWRNKNQSEPKTPPNEPKVERSEAERNKNNEAFEKRKKPRCFRCNSTEHLRPNCPLMKKNPETSDLNRIIEKGDENVMSPYTFKGEVNGFTMPILRDTGTSIDVVCRNRITPDMLTGENIWVQQPLDEFPVCLPLAEVELKGEFGHVITKAAVVSSQLDKGRYLLGNQTAALLETMKTEDVPHQINAIETRAQRRKAEQEHQVEDEIEEVVDKEENEEDEITIDEDDLFSFPPKEDNYEGLALLKVDSKTFADQQKECPELKSLLEKVQENTSEHVGGLEKLKNGILVKRRMDKSGVERLLLVVPKKYRTDLKALCHEGTSGHLGVTKTKDLFSRHFFWPQCYKEIEDYVRSCDRCQRVGKPFDKKKAPMKIVPVIQEVFSKINVDACGPLPVTPSGKRYLLTAMCLSSKYPDAVPVEDITSVTVVDALMQIFSRMGFPKILQLDQGSSFTSELSTTFLEKFGIKVVHSSVYHPQSNPIERFHRTVKRVLKVLCLESGSNWEQAIYPALFALRTVTHESTGFTPAELVHGKNLRTPLTLLYEKWLDLDETEGEPVTEYVFSLLNRMKRCQELAITKMEECQQKNKTWYDKRAVKREFREGDLVLIFATFKSNKLSPHWTGPGTILRKLSETNYVVQLPGDKATSKVYHVNMLKPYHKRPEEINYLISDLEGENDEELMDILCVDSNPNVLDLEEMFRDCGENSGLNEEQIIQMKKLICKYEKCFSNVPGETDLVIHDIELNEEQPILSKPYRTSPRQSAILKTEIQKMLDMKIIEIGFSDCTSPMILVEAPGKDPRPCIDYRNLNKITKTKFFPLPNIEERIEIVSAAQYITVLDLSKGYWQIPLTERAQRLAAFVTNFGTYKPLRMPFGLKNAPYEFSKMVYQLLEGCEDFAVPYLDDIAIFSSNFPEHLKQVETVLKRIESAGLTIKPSKCKFAQAQVQYLGHIVGQGLRKPAELKIEAIKNFQPPKSKTEVRAFLGLAGYYARYIPMFSSIAAPLTDALKGKARKGPITWTKECEEAFDKLKNSLCSFPVLYSPDYKKPFIVETDASDQGIGVVLSQLSDEAEQHPVIYLSKKFNSVEKKYSVSEKECAAIIFAVSKLKCYLDGNCFKIVTDHNPLVWLNTHASSNARLMRWSLILQPFNFEIIHRKGKLHQNADGLSRIHTL